MRHRRSTGRAGPPLHELVGDAFEVEIVPLLDAVQYHADYLRKNPTRSRPEKSRMNRGAGGVARVYGCAICRVQAPSVYRHKVGAFEIACSATATALRPQCSVETKRAQKSC